MYMPVSGRDDCLMVPRCIRCVSEASLENDDITIGVIIRLIKCEVGCDVVGILGRNLQWCFRDIYMVCRMNSLIFMVAS
jgi:hypothetical protein